VTDLRLEPVKLIETAEMLHRRVCERFPGSGLSRVGEELVKRATQAEQGCAHVREPHRPVRMASGMIICGLVLFALWAAAVAFDDAATAAGAPADWRDIPTVGEAVVNEVLLLGAAIWFFVSLERKRKRERVFAAMNELRTVAHLIDIHQLSKNPETLFDGGPDTPSSPKRELSPFLMARYFDYCSEMLALTGKVAALYGDAFEDAEALKSVNDLEELCIGLQRKIWQKLIILEARVGRAPGVVPAPSSPEEE